MLVIPPRSQQLKLALSYDDWANIQKALMTSPGSGEKKLGLIKRVQEIRNALLKEGHV